MRSRIATKSKEDVPYLHDRQIEEEANVLLAQFETEHGTIAGPPVPIEDITEAFLGLAMEWKDLQASEGHPDVHGAIYFPQRKIAIDLSVNPADNPRKEGRYRFTIAHEVGHWRLHRKHYLKDAAQGLLSADMANERPSYVCRDGVRNRVETQANRFGAYLLMPARMVKAAWHAEHGVNVIALDSLRANKDKILFKEFLHRGSTPAAQDAVDDVLLEHAARPIAKKFKVSAHAMRIRLETLGLLVQKVEVGLF